MYLKFVNSRFAGIIFILGHLTWFAEWDETVNETLPVNDVLPEILLEVLRLTGRRIHPIDTEPTAFRRSDTIQKQFGFRIIEQCVDSTTRFPRTRIRRRCLLPGHVACPGIGSPAQSSPRRTV